MSTDEIPAAIADLYAVYGRTPNEAVIRSWTRRLATEPNAVTALRKLASDPPEQLPKLRDVLRKLDTAAPHNTTSWPYTEAQSTRMVRTALRHLHYVQDGESFPSTAWVDRYHVRLRPLPPWAILDAIGFAISHRVELGLPGIDDLVLAAQRNADSGVWLREYIPPDWSDRFEDFGPDGEPLDAIPFDLKMASMCGNYVRWREVMVAAGYWPAQVADCMKSPVAAQPEG